MKKDSDSSKDLPQILFREPLPSQKEVFKQCVADATTTELRQMILEIQRQFSSFYTSVR